MYSERSEEAIGFHKKAMRLDPNYPFYVIFMLGNSYRALRRYDEAISAYREAARRNPEWWGPHEALATIYAELGREKEARAEVAEILRLNPGESVSWLRKTLPFKNQADLDRFIAALQKAGLK
jgi:tetratricopeptide (TPR) repeat protein